MILCIPIPVQTPYHSHDLSFSLNIGFCGEKQLYKKERGHEVHLKCRHSFWPAGPDDLDKSAQSSSSSLQLSWPSPSSLLTSPSSPSRTSSSSSSWPDCRILGLSAADDLGAKVRWVLPHNPDTTSGQEREETFSYLPNLQIPSATSLVCRPERNTSSLLQMRWSWLAGLVISLWSYLMPSHHQLHVTFKAQPLRGTQTSSQASESELC